LFLIWERLSLLCTWKFYLFEYIKLQSWRQLFFKDRHNASFLGNVHQRKACVSDFAIFCVHVHVPVWVRNNAEEIYKVNSYARSVRLGIRMKNFVCYILIYIKSINIFAFSSVVRQMPGYTSQRRSTVGTLPNWWTVLIYLLFVSIVLFYVFFVCKFVLYYCHRVANQLQINISYHIMSYRIISHHIISYRIIS
jgi:hypothetical protein